VLVTIAGTLGRVGVVREVDLPANTNQAVSIVRLRDRSLTPWVSTWLRGPAAQSELTGGGRGVGLQNLNLKQIGAISVPLPPLADQRRIVARVEEQLSAIDALRAAIERAQRRSASLRRSVLERAFRGELVPQDPTDEPASALLERIRAERRAAEKDNRQPSRRVRR
jgi:type I restriction enzyme S subunit